MTNFLLEWKVIAAAQLYWPIFFATEKVANDIVAAVLIGLGLVFAVWLCIWLIERGPLGHNTWVRQHLLHR